MAKAVTKQKMGKSTAATRRDKSVGTVAKRRPKKPALRAGRSPLLSTHGFVRGTTKWSTTANDPAAPRKMNRLIKLIRDNASAGGVAAPETPLHDVSSADEDEKVSKAFWRHEQTPFYLSSLTPGLLATAALSGTAGPMAESPPPMPPSVLCCRRLQQADRSVNAPTETPTTIISDAYHNSFMLHNASVEDAATFERICQAKWTETFESSFLQNVCTVSPSSMVGQLPGTPLPLLPTTPHEVLAKKFCGLQLPSFATTRRSFQKRLDDLEEAEMIDTAVEDTSEHTACKSNLTVALPNIDMAEEAGHIKDEISAAVDEIVTTTCSSYTMTNSPKKPTFLFVRACLNDNPRFSRRSPILKTAASLRASIDDNNGERFHWRRGSSQNWPDIPEGTALENYDRRVEVSDIAATTSTVASTKSRRSESSQSSNQLMGSSATRNS